MRIGIITPYDAANCGAFLQAYASMLFLKSHGHDVFMIKWQSKQARKANFFEECQPIIPLIIQLIKQPRIYRANRLKKELIHYIFSYNQYCTIKKALREFDVIDQENIEKYSLDMIVIGSDIVWDISVPAFENPIFYGKNLPSDIPCYAYAPSSGNCEVKDFNLFSEPKNGIKDMDIIGVRDLKTANIVEAISKIRPNIVCDPTLLIDIGKYNVSAEPLVKGKYLLVYSYGVKEKYREYLKKYAERYGLKLVAAFLFQDWCDINIACTPLEFCNLIKFAESVFTTTFHGSIFTFLNHKPCAVFAKEQKIQDLLEWTGMENVAVYDNIEYNQFEKILQTHPKYNTFDRELNVKRTESVNLYLDSLDKVKH